MKDADMTREQLDRAIEESGHAAGASDQEIEQVKEGMHQIEDVLTGAAPMPGAEAPSPCADIAGDSRLADWDENNPLGGQQQQRGRGGYSDGADDGRNESRR